MNELIDLKRKLYSALLKKMNHSDTELNIMFELSKDEDIQNILDSMRDKRKLEAQGK